MQRTAPFTPPVTLFETCVLSMPTLGGPVVADILNGQEGSRETEAGDSRDGGGVARGHMYLLFCLWTRQQSRVELKNKSCDKCWCVGCNQPPITKNIDCDFSF